MAIDYKTSYTPRTASLVDLAPFYFHSNLIINVVLHGSNQRASVHAPAHPRPLVPASCARKRWRNASRGRAKRQDLQSWNCVCGTSSFSVPVYPQPASRVFFQAVESVPLKAKKSIRYLFFDFCLCTLPGPCTTLTQLTATTRIASFSHVASQLCDRKASLPF